MKDWTEYRAGDEWPEGENLEWQKNIDGVWVKAPEPAIAWSNGHRIRYREREPEMVKAIFFDDGSISYIGNVIDRWMFLAAPIAAYHKDMRYMACDEDGEVWLSDTMIKPEDDCWILSEAEGIVHHIATIPFDAMPADWTTAIVELAHEGEEK